jgi:hypothetical protein
MGVEGKGKGGLQEGKVNFLSFSLAASKLTRKK